MRRMRKDKRSKSIPKKVRRKKVEVSLMNKKRKSMAR